MDRDAQLGDGAASLDVCQKSSPDRATLHEQENSNVTIWQSRWQKCGESIARTEIRETSLGPWRKRRKSHEPSAGDRHRSVRSAQARRQGPEEEVVARLDSAKKGVNQNQVFPPLSHRKQTIAASNKCQLFAMYWRISTRQCPPSRIRRNSMKINGRALGYSSLGRGISARHFPCNFRAPNSASIDNLSASQNVTGGVI